MRVPKGLYTGGDYYPTVRIWMVKLGVKDLDVCANRIPVTEAQARQLITRYVGPTCELSVRVLHGSLGLGSAERITISRKALAEGRVTVGLVLHECAHALQNRKYLDRKAIRQEKLAAWRRLHGKNSIKAHGEAFCRSYAKLLRAYFASEPHVASEGGTEADRQYWEARSALRAARANDQG
jgi:hypothetical protein